MVSAARSPAPRSIGKAPSVTMSLRRARVPEQLLLGHVAQRPVADHADDHRVDVGLVVGDRRSRGPHAAGSPCPRRGSDRRRRRAAPPASGRTCTGRCRRDRRAAGPRASSAPPTSARRRADCATSHGVDDLVERHARRCPPRRRRRPCAAARRARVESRRSRSSRAASTWASSTSSPGLAQLRGAARRPHLRARRQEDLDGRVGEHVGADVAALHDDVGVAGEAPLLVDQQRAHAGQRRDARGRRAHLQRADRRAHVALAGEQAAVAVEAQPAPRGHARRRRPRRRARTPASVASSPTARYIAPVSR